MNPPVPRRILVVDDEPNIVSAVRRELNTPPLGHHRYEVECFSDPAAALERARAQEFDAVVSDFRMPGMDGLEFLKALAALQPDCARLVLSGRTDLGSLVRMVNETRIFRFIPKPWHDYFLKSSVGQAIDHHAALRESRRLADKVREHGIAVPPPAPGVEQVLVVDDDPGVCAALERVFAGHTAADDLFAAIRAELAGRGGAPLVDGRVSVQTTTSPLHALKMLDDLTFSCIVADLHMKEMSGIELLRQFAERQPDCERVLMSGRLTQEELVDAVDTVHVFGVVAKPWEDYDLKACVAQALTRRRMLSENRTLAEMVRKAGGADA